MPERSSRAPLCRDAQAFGAHSHMLGGGGRFGRDGGSMVPEGCCCGVVISHGCLADVDPVTNMGYRPIDMTLGPNETALRSKMLL